MLQSKAAAGGKLEGNQLEKLSRSKAIAEQHRACLEERQQLLVVADVATRAKFGACTNCGREGHTDANCPRPKSKQAAGAAAAGRKQLPRRDKTFKERSSTATHRTSIARASKGLTSTASSACADAKGQRKLPRDHARTRGIFLDGSSGAAGTIVASSPSSSQKQKTSCSACTFFIALPALPPSLLIRPHRSIAYVYTNSLLQLHSQSMFLRTTTVSSTTLERTSHVKPSAASLTASPGR